MAIQCKWRIGMGYGPHAQVAELPLMLTASMIVVDVETMRRIDFLWCGLVCVCDNLECAQNSNMIDFCAANLEQQTSYSVCSRVQKRLQLAYAGRRAKNPLVSAVESVLCFFAVCIFTLFDGLLACCFVAFCILRSAVFGTIPSAVT